MEPKNIAVNQKIQEIVGRETRRKKNNVQWHVEHLSMGRLIISPSGGTRNADDKAAFVLGANLQASRTEYIETSVAP